MDAGHADGPPADHRMPRWVKAFLIAGAVLAVLLAAALLLGGGPGEHGPGRHASPDAGPSGDGDHAPPEGEHHEATPTGPGPTATRAGGGPWR